MKRIIFVAAMIAVLPFFASCQKEAECVVNQINGKRCALSVSLAGVSEVFTKIPGVVADDNVIRDVQILVFNIDRPEGKLDASAHFKNLSSSGSYTSSSTLSCTRGKREIWVIVNSKVNYVDGDVADKVDNLSSLEDKTTVLSDNEYASNSFVMAGNKLVDLDSEEYSSTVEVRRMAAKIVVKKIENRMLVPVYQKEGAVRITGAYLMNVAGRQKYNNLNTVDAPTSLTSSLIDDQYWFGKNTRESNSSLAPLLSETYSPAKPVRYESCLTDVSTFYVYPNDAAPSENAAWDRRASVLVICANVTGTDCVYPVQLPQLESGKQYEVSLVIKHVGGDPSKPWEKIKFENMSPAIDVSPWVTVGGINEII